MSATGAVDQNRIVRFDWRLPPTVQERLRKMALDKFTGNVELNIKCGQIRGFHVKEQIEVPQNEIK